MIRGPCVGTINRAAVFRPFRARYIRLAGHLGFRFAPPQAITLRAFSPELRVMESELR